MISTRTIFPFSHIDLFSPKSAMATKHGSEGIAGDPLFHVYQNEIEMREKAKKGPLTVSSQVLGYTLSKVFGLSRDASSAQKSVVGWYIFKKFGVAGLMTLSQAFQEGVPLVKDGVSKLAAQGSNAARFFSLLKRFFSFWPEGSHACTWQLKILLPVSPF